MTEGYTSWVGNAARSRTAFAAHWFGVRTRRSGNVEDNWGFTWTDPSYARPQTPLYHALLALGLGSGSCSVYTACATENWDAVIDLDGDGLRSEGLDPQDYGPPYCPGAPLSEDGTANPNTAALHALRDLLREHAPALSRGGYAADVLLFASASLAGAGAWPEDDDEEGTVLVLRSAVELAGDLMNHHQFGVDVITEATAPASGADRGAPWLVPVTGGPQRDNRLRALLQERLRAGGSVVLLSANPLTGPWADWTGPALVAPAADTVLPLLPPPRYAHPQSGPGTVLVHEDPQGRPVALFAFNPGVAPTTIRRSVAGDEVVVNLAPGGSACLIGDGRDFPAVLIVPGPDALWTPGRHPAKETAHAREDAR
jgi:hypothetical protein